MKSVQVISAAENCEYAIYELTDEQFALMFPNGQNVEFMEDFLERVPPSEETDKIFADCWSRRINKEKIVGIHGTLFDRLLYKKGFYPSKKDYEMWDGYDSFP